VEGDIDQPVRRIIGSGERGFLDAAYAVRLDRALPVGVISVGNGLQRGSARAQEGDLGEPVQLVVATSEKVCVLLSILI
jgi:hypothetical protein